MRFGMRFFIRKERLLFVSPKPASRSPASAVGQVLEHQGRLYRVTRWVEARPVALERGGSVGQWEVWGRRISNRQIRREIVSAAQAVLDDSQGGED